MPPKLSDVEAAKAAMRALIIACAKGNKGGLSLVGLLLERLGAYTNFITLELKQQARFRQPPTCRNEAELPPPDECVFDVGSNNGDDTAYYLRKGFRVIAIEANPTLAKVLRRRYADEIEVGKVKVLNIAVIADGRSQIEFFVNDVDRMISTAIAPENSGSFRSVRVRSETLSRLIRKFGLPYYLKLDIEGCDHGVLHELFATPHRPPFISAESHSIEVLINLVAAGYRRFKVVEGRFVHLPYYRGTFYDATGEPFTHEFPEHSSGPFGDDIPGPWLDLDEVFEYLSVHGLGWKDIHAAW